MLTPSEHDKLMFGLPSTFIFHYMCRTPAQVKKPTAETLWQEKADWDHGTMVSIKLYRSHVEKREKGQSDEHVFLEPGWVHEGSWGCFREKKKNKLQQPINMLGEYKTENCSKPLMDLTWACAPHCLILLQKFIHGQDKHWGPLLIFSGTMGKELLRAASPGISSYHLTLWCTLCNTGFKNPTLALLGSLDGSFWTFSLIFTFPSPAAFLQNQQEVCCPGLHGCYTSVPRNSVCLLLNPQDMQWCQSFIS